LHYPMIRIVLSVLVHQARTSPESMSDTMKTASARKSPLARCRRWN
jgi:hypothetical protein